MDLFLAGSLRQNCPDAHPIQRFVPHCFFSFFWLPFFYVLVCCTEGAAGLPTNTSYADIRGCIALRLCTSTRVHSVRTHSAFNRGVIAPLHRSSPCRYCASVFWFCRLPVPSEVNRKLRPRLPSSSTLSIPKPIPSANRGLT